MREPVVCPKCHALHEPDGGAKTRRNPTPRPSQAPSEPETVGETVAVADSTDEPNNRISIDGGEELIDEGEESVLVDTTEIDDESDVNDMVGKMAGQMIVRTIHLKFTRCPSRTTYSQQHFFLLH